MKRISVEELQDRFDEILEEVLKKGEEFEVCDILCVIKPIPNQEGWGNDQSTKPQQYRIGTKKTAKRNRNKG